MPLPVGEMQPESEMPPEEDLNAMNQLSIKVQIPSRPSQAVRRASF